mgnify:CR=1 FL=1
MIAKPTAYEVGCRITEYRSTVILARDEAEAKAQVLYHADFGRFEVTSGVEEGWAAHVVEP